jgi:hypothetical protein
MKNDVFTNASGQIMYTGNIGHAIHHLTNGVKVARLAWRGHSKHLVMIGNTITLIEHNVEISWKPEQWDLTAWDYAVDPQFLTDKE